MRKLAILIMLIIGYNSFSQKKELRQITKLVNENFYEEALSSLDEIKNLVEVSDDERLKATYFYNRAISERETGEFSNSINSYKSLINIDDSKYSTTIKLEIENLKLLIENAIVNSAVNDNKENKYDSSMKKLFLAYQFNGNEEYLYYAAGSAVNSKNYDNAIKYYLELKDNGYTGIIDEYFVTNNESGLEEKVTETEYDLFKDSKEYSNPRIGQTESRYPEIIKNIALLYVVQKKIDLAISAIDEARKIQPDDVNLILNEADIYLNLTQNTDDDDLRARYELKFKELMELAVSKDPENGVLYFNLGFVSLENNDFEAAAKYFYKSIEKKPDHIDSYLGLIQIRLDEQDSINEEISNLVMSRKKSDLDRLDQLEEEKLDLYRECALLSENILEYDSQNRSALKYLSQFYYFLDRLDDRKVNEAKCMEIYGSKCSEI
tara:strand:- start:788 stop:2095 length:1308 start_codon:yes stop_codon:yes gene_type:complete